jgi:hypothetical protein
MIPEDLARAVNDYRPLSHAAFIESLRKLHFRDPSWMYSAVGDPNPWQGDIAFNARLVLVNDDGESAGVHVGAAVLLSPGCDMVPGRVRYVSMAPVYPVASLADDTGEIPQAELASLQSNTISTLLHLPAAGLLPESFVDFELVCPVPAGVARTFFSAGDANATRIRLTENGWRLLTAKYWYHTARDENRSDFPRA